MLRSKKIISSVLPKIRELPEEYYAYCAEKVNDGKILFQLNRRRTREKAGYYCLKCGYAGEVEREMPICKNCGKKGVACGRISKKRKKGTS